MVPIPKEKSVVSLKWIYKKKHADDGSIEKYRAIFVASGFSQKEDIDDGRNSLSWQDIPRSGV
jgi:hypothetical protein